jgi:GNAT superfamily N-acetyltransferase
MRRAVGFVRSLGAVHERAGAVGVLELVVARALPDVLSYSRTVIVATPAAGTRPTELPSQPTMDLRRVRESEPAIEAFYERLAPANEPEVPTFSTNEIERRFSAGQELWVVEVEGQIAHTRWIVPGERRFPGGFLPLQDDERASEALVTAPEFRGRGLTRASREHLGAVLSGEGVRRIYSAPSGFNRGFLAATLRTSGAEHVVTTHLVSVGGRHWLRATPASADKAALLDQRGVPHGRWMAP